MKYQNKVYFPFITALLLLTFTIGSAYGREYTHNIQDDNMTFAWSVNGDNLDIKVSAPTTGWVAIGFNPSMRMKHANIIIGYVVGNKVVISDEFGSRETGHSPDQKNNITNTSGSEINGVTTLEFTIPLHSGDPDDGMIEPNSETTVIFAYGAGSDNLYSRHKYRATKTINLATGSGSGELDHSTHTHGGSDAH